MADFNAASIWIKLALFFTCLSFLLDLFGLTANMPVYSNAIEAVVIISFLCYLVSIILILGYTFLDELSGNKAALICYIVFSLVAGFCAIISIALVGSHSYKVGSKWVTYKINTYLGLLITMAGIMELMAGIFGILALVGVAAK